MPELRTDWLTGRSVIVAENRAGRPNEFAVRPGYLPTAADSPPRYCPFCPGHEADTPPTVYEQTDAAGHWQIRVIPNKFPALTMGADDSVSSPTSPLPPEAIVAEFPCAELSFAPPAERRPAAGVAAVAPAVGAHEVIIESARHVRRTAELSASELHHVLEAYAARLAYWRDDERLRFALVFKNQGPNAGASLGHLHSQLIALPAVPAAIARELARAEQAYGEEGICPYCRWIAQERAAAQRIVLDRDGFIAFCPSASLQPFETWLLPTEHAPWFEQPLRPEMLERLSGVLHALIARLESLLPEPSYNLLLRTSPWTDGIEPCSHWRIELLPRLASLAGMELGTGIHINPLAPEHAAERLREI